MEEHKRDRTLYEIASSFFAVVVIGFAIGGMLFAALGDDGVASGAFAICTVFLVLGLGRLYLGMRRGNEGAEDPAAAPVPDEAPAEHRRARPDGARRPPARRRRP